MYSKFMTKAWSLGSEVERQQDSVTDHMENQVNNFKGIKTGEPVTRELFPYRYRNELVEVFIKYNTPSPALLLLSACSALDGTTSSGLIGPA